ncbi:MAG: chromate transporter [Coriobacteriales bacterium]|nr:chromate transporter [Coriobacteriales bacterium]
MADERHGIARRSAALFLSTFAISATTNTGYAILAAMRKSFVERHGWLAEEEMADYVALAQSAPGPMAINASVVVGWQVAGPAGAAAAVLGCALPPFLTMVAVTLLYDGFAHNVLVAAFLRGMQLGVVAMLIDVLVGMAGVATKGRGAYPWVLMLASFAYVRLTGCSIAWLAIACAAVGVARATLAAREAKAGGDV